MRLLWMFRTGARADALATLLSRAGIAVTSERTAAPRLEMLPAHFKADLLDLYRSLGGRLDRPSLRPGARDLALAAGIVVELDDELYVNRYRAETLERPWSGRLPWRDHYLAMCPRCEPACLRAARGGSVGRTSRAK